MAWTYDSDMRVLAYTSGSVAFTVAETITGSVGGATGVVVSSIITSGTIVAGDAAGNVYFKTLVGAFEAEDLNGSVGGAGMATISGVSTLGFDNRSYLRLILGDTDTAFQLFTDNELDGWITKYTTGGQVLFLKAGSICLKSLAVDPDRLSVLADKLGGAMKMESLMDMCWKRAEALGG